MLAFETSLKEKTFLFDWNISIGVREISWGTFFFPLKESKALKWGFLQKDATF
jgi:hypothetical protein